jgi:predicted permease
MKQVLRRLWQRPMVFIAAITTLTLGIGIGTVLFTWVNFILLRPLPIDHPTDVFSIEFRGRPGVSFPNYRDVRDRNRVFTHVAAMRFAPMNLSQDGGNARTWGYLVTGNYFELLGIRPKLGRLIASTDDVQTGGHPVTVISHGAWTTRFGSDPSVIGKTIRLNNHAFTIVGVAPEGFIGTQIVFATEFWVPFSMIQEIEGRDWREARTTSNSWAIARLKPGVSRNQALASLKVMAADMARETPAINEGLEISLATPGLIAGAVRRPATGLAVMLLSLAGLTLIVACANLSGLMLAQSADRQKEMAIRVALGARRAELFRMLVAEVAVISVAGGAFGLLLSRWFARFLVSLIPPAGFPIQLDLSMDWRVFAFALTASAISAGLFGLWPSIRISRVDVIPGLKNETAAAFRRFHLRDGYVAVQIVIAVVLMSSAVIMARAVQSMLAMDLGMEPDNAVVVRFAQYLQGYTPEQGRQFQQRVLARVRSLPGIQSASISNSIPLSIDQSSTSIYIEGAPIPKASEITTSAIYQVEPDFFRSFGTDVLSGRDFNDADQANSPPVAIVNKTFVDKLLPGQDPLGQRFRTGQGGPLLEIVGVVKSSKYQHLFESPLPAIWRPLSQQYNGTSTIIARIQMDDAAAIRALKASIDELDPNMPIFDAQNLRRFLDFPMAPLLFARSSLTMMSGLAIFLSALGIYGLLAYSMVRRTREIGIRVVLGATRWDVLRVLTSKTALLIGASATIGLPLSFAVSRLLTPLLLEKPKFSSYAVAVLIVIGVAGLACVLPTRRALRIAPSEALRHD